MEFSKFGLACVAVLSVACMCLILKSEAAASVSTNAPTCGSQWQPGCIKQCESKYSKTCVLINMVNYLHFFSGYRSNTKLLMGR